MAVLSGFCESHKPPPLGDVCGIVPGAPPRPSKWSTKLTHLLLPWRPPGQYGASSTSFIRRCALYCFNVSAWPSKWPGVEVHLFAVADFFDCCNHSLRPCHGQLK